MIDSRRNKFAKALESRCGIQGFFFRMTLAAFIAVSVCGVFAASRATAQETVVEFVDSEKLDFRIRVRAAEGKKLPEKTTVSVWLDGSDQKSDPSVLGKVTTEDLSLIHI